MILWQDYDSNLVDFGNAQCEYVNKLLGLASPISLEDVESWTYLEEEYGNITTSFWKTPGVYRDIIKPHQGAQEFIRELQNKHGVENVWIITNSDPGLVEEKDQHAHDYFNIPYSQIVHHWEKYRYTHSGILMDDYHKNIHEHVEYTGNPAIAFNLNNMHPWAYEKWFKEDPKIHYCTSYRSAMNVIDHYTGMHKGVV